MNTRIEDWKVTAFALGELAGKEAQSIAVAIAARPELRRRAEEARRRADWIEESLATEGEGPVEVQPVAEPAPVPRRGRVRRSTWWFVAATAAACAVLAITWPSMTAARKSVASVDEGEFVITTHPVPHGTDYDSIRVSREWRGEPTLVAMERPADGAEYEDAVIFFPEAGESDHNESADRQGGDGNVLTSACYLAGNPGPSRRWQGEMKTRGPSSDSMGVGPGAVGGLYGGRSGSANMAMRAGAPPARAAAGAPRPQPDVAHNTEDYSHIAENAFLAAWENPLSTFSIDVDTASYANVRRFLTGGMLPPPDAVRIEELVNYFTYAYAQPVDEHPYAVHLELAACPWKSGHRLLRVGLKGREIEVGKRPPSNLVFLLDVSGSMNRANKLPLVQSAMSMLVDQLTESDRVSIVVYAGASGLVLPPTRGDQKAPIRDAIEQLRPGGSTNGASGIQLAYAIAMQNFVEGGTNRVILATDGDWNVGVTSRGDLVRLIEEKATSGVFLSVLGFGMGNLKDGMLEQLADKGNGNYAYIDTLAEGRKVLVEQMAGTLCTIAKDVKVQIEFNPARVASYRLIGYENRLLAKEDFNDDKKDAGEIGAGHTVTALYEVVPAGSESPDGRPSVDPLKYQQPSEPTGAAASAELCTVKLRYKPPQSDTSTLMEVPLSDERARFDDASEDFRFAAAVAGYGMLLRRSEHAKGFTWDALAEIAGGSVGADPSGYRAEFVKLVRRAKSLSR